MNNVFKVVFNRNLGCFVVASELAKGIVKSSTTLAIALPLTFSPLANAYVEGVVNGAGGTAIGSSAVTTGQNNYALKL